MNVVIGALEVAVRLIEGLAEVEQGIVPQVLQGGVEVVVFVHQHAVNVQTQGVLRQGDGDVLPLVQAVQSGDHAGLVVPGVLGQAHVELRTAGAEK